MLKRIMNAIIGKQEVVTLGLDKATAIFQEAKGKFDGSANKAVPFAIMATARALGAEVTLHAEGKEKTAELSSDATMANNTAVVANTKRQEQIANFRKTIEQLEADIRIEGEAAVTRISALEKEKKAVKEVIDFFTV